MAKFSNILAQPALQIIFLSTFITTNCLALSSDQKKPYHISANSIVYTKKQKQIIYIGNVVMTQGTSRLSGEKAVMHLDNNSHMRELTTYGHPAHYSTLPDHKQHKLYARADIIYYYPKQKAVLLVRHGKITQNGNVFTGPHIWYNIDKGIIKSKPMAGNKQRTVVIIQPQQTKKNT